MAWIVKNVTRGNVYLGDVKLMFTPGEEIDVDVCVEIRRYRGSNDLLTFLKKGYLQTIHKDQDSQLEAEMNLQTRVQSAPVMQSIPETLNEPIVIDPDTVKTVVKEVLDETSRIGQKDQEEKLEIILQEVVRKELEFLIESLPQNISPTSIGEVASDIREKVATLDTDALTAQIHARRMDANNSINIDGEIESSETVQDGSVSNLVNLLKSIEEKEDGTD